MSYICILQIQEDKYYFSTMTGASIEGEAYFHAQGINGKWESVPGGYKYMDGDCEIAYITKEPIDQKLVLL